MIKYFIAAISGALLFAASPLARPDTPEIPAERIFPSSVGAVTFRHQLHLQERGIQCVECHHQINAKKLKTPHPDYFKSTYVKCEICHNASENIRQRAYSCSGCHPANPANIADETLSAKVVIYKQCWKCHPVGTGKEASVGCKKCHSGKKTF